MPIIILFITYYVYKTTANLVLIMNPQIEERGWLFPLPRRKPGLRVQ